MLRPLLLGTLFVAAGCSGGSDGTIGASHGAPGDPTTRDDRDDDGTDDRGTAVSGTTDTTGTPASQGSRARRGRPSLADEADPSDAPVEDRVDTAFGVASLAGGSSALRYRARFVTELPYPTYEFILNNTGSGWQEKFLLQVPATPPTVPTPLLVVFHKYGAGHGDVIHTSFPAEAYNRGWYLLAPLGARQRNFGSLESQINTRAAIDLVLDLFGAIDRTRIYGVGFSMGGGALANYAAHHVDPNGAMFAAICDHTGTVSLAHTHYFEVDDDDSDDNVPTPGDNLEPPDVLEATFGGTPGQVPFTYQRFSTIDLDPIQGTVGAGTDMSRNLAHVPTLVWLAQYDPNVYLRDQTIAFDAHIHAQNPANEFQQVLGDTHRWSTMDYTYVCDWLAQRTLTVPTSGSTLADEDGRFFCLTVQQDIPGTFTPFTWSCDPATKTLVVSASENLYSLSLDLVELGIAATGDLTIDVSTNDGTGDKFLFTNVPSAPIAAARDGVSATTTYDAAARTLAFTESDPALHHWVLSFP